VNSGSSALHLGIESFDFPKGSEVITPALTFGTTVSSIVKNNLIPAFVDVKERTFCIDENQIEYMITDNTVAILAPDLLGNICNWPEIRRIANKYNLKVIQDSADTLGSEINGISTGQYSDMSITSFYGSHIINCAGNGGALCLNDDEVIERALLLRSWGRSSSLFEESEKIENRFNISVDNLEYDAKFIFSLPGYNLEGNEVGASFGLVQLQKLSDNMKLRQENFDRQINFFEGLDFFVNPEQTKNTQTAWLAFPILLSSFAPFTRKEFQIYLEKNDIQTRVCFTGNILRQPMSQLFDKKINESGYSNADNVMKNCVLLPVHHGMANSMFIRLHKTIEKFIDQYK
jgi:CDP-6-deoxy-D-xylo-4-hexulose-3-dehydrase